MNQQVYYIEQYRWGSDLETKSRTISALSMQDLIAQINISIKNGFIVVAYFKVKLKS